MKEISQSHGQLDDGYPMAMSESPSRNFWPVRIIAVSLVVLIIVAMVFAQVKAQSNARKNLEDRFAVRATTASTFLDSYIQYTLEREKELATLRLGAPKVSHDEFLTFLDNFDFGPSVLLDDKGLLLDIAPYSESLIGQQMTTEYEHLRDALDGRPSVSNIVPSAAQGFPIVAFATPFETGSGRRVISGAFDLTTKPLGTYLKNALPYKNSAAYLLDKNNMVIASDKNKSGELADVNSALAAHITDDRGTYTLDGDEVFFVKKEIPSTPWTVVLTVHKSMLFSPLNGTNTLLPWVFLVGFALLLCILVFIFIRNRERRLSLQDVALIDLLTGIYNTRGVKAMLTRLISAQRRHEFDLSVIVIDFLNFERLNEKFGNHIGDEILVATAEEIKNQLRTEDMVGRWSGKQFMVLLPETPKTGAQVVANRIRSAIESARTELAEADTSLTCTITVAKSDDTLDTFLARVEETSTEAQSSSE